MAEKRFLTDEELDKNYDAFKEALPDLMKNHAGRYVVVRDEKVLDAFDTSRDAYIFGWRQFKDDLFSIQEVTDRPVYLGIFSHVLDFGTS